MKLGRGLYRHQLDEEHFRFARQCGCTHLVVHLVDYFRSSRTNRRGSHPLGDDSGWGRAGDPSVLWGYEELAALKRRINDAGMEWAAIGNFDPAHWHDVLLDGPQKVRQLENFKTMIRTVGRVGVPVIGYNFSLAGVAGRLQGPFARGGALSVGMDGITDQPLPHGMVWNMVYDLAATPEQLWRRLADFLGAVIPVAEEAGVIMAAHPDDPPASGLRGQPRLVYQPQLYQRVIDLQSSPHNQLEFCLGSIAEMTEGNVYEATDAYSRQGWIAHVHFRNVRGKVPHYHEAFVDDGDIDILRILQSNRFEGVLIPDHAPQMSCTAPWHAGMAFALEYMRAALQALDSPSA